MNDVFWKEMRSQASKLVSKFLFAKIITTCAVIALTLDINQSHRRHFSKSPGNNSRRLVIRLRLSRSSTISCGFFLPSRSKISIARGLTRGEAELNSEEFHVYSWYYRVVPLCELLRFIGGRGLRVKMARSPIFHACSYLPRHLIPNIPNGTCVRTRTTKINWSSVRNELSRERITYAPRVIQSPKFPKKRLSTESSQEESREKVERNFITIPPPPPPPPLVETNIWK